MYKMSRAGNKDTGKRIEYGGAVLDKGVIKALPARGPVSRDLSGGASRESIWEERAPGGGSSLCKGPAAGAGVALLGAAQPPAQLQKAAQRCGEALPSPGASAHLILPAL